MAAVEDASCTPLRLGIRLEVLVPYVNAFRNASQ